jgi:hypothetical protein
MCFTLSGVNISDAESIARHIEVPAMQNGPLYRTMFPQSDTLTENQREEITRWYVQMLEYAFQDRWERFLKACTADGTPIGFCGWTVIERKCEHQTYVDDGPTNKQAKKEKRKKATWVPETIDIEGWISVSEALKAERDRVLKDLDNICRR